jgi:hypothetical protein
VTTADLYRRLTLAPKTVVFGWTLVPYTVGHAILFNRLQVEAVKTTAEICLAARLCSMPADKAERWLSGRWSGWRVSWMLRTREAWLKDAAEVARAIEVWSEWLDEQTRVPRYIAKHPADEESGVPFAQRLRVALMSKLGYRPGDVDRTPYRQALWDYISWAEMEGMVRVPVGLSDEDEAELARQADEVAAKIQKGELKVHA